MVVVSPNPNPRRQAYVDEEAGTPTAAGSSERQSLLASASGLTSPDSGTPTMSAAVARMKSALESFGSTPSAVERPHKVSRDDEDGGMQVNQRGSAAGVVVKKSGRRWKLPASHAPV